MSGNYRHFTLRPFIGLAKDEELVNTGMNLPKEKQAQYFEILGQVYREQRSAEAALKVAEGVPNEYREQFKKGVGE